MTAALHPRRPALLVMAFTAIALVGLLTATLPRNLAAVSALRQAEAVPPLTASGLVADGSSAAPAAVLTAAQVGSFTDPATRATLDLLAGQPLAAADASSSGGVLADTRSSVVRALAETARQDPSAARDTLRGVPGVGRALVSEAIRQQQAGNFAAASQLLLLATDVAPPAELEPAVVDRLLSNNAYNVDADWDTAVQWAQRWRAADPGPNAAAWLAALYLWHGQPEDAASAWDGIDPAQAAAHPFYASQMGQVYQARGDWPDAIHLFQTAYDRDNATGSDTLDYDAWYLGAALARSGDAAAARPYLSYVAAHGRESLAGPAQRLLAEMGG